SWPKNIVPWFWTGSASERHKLFVQLKKEITGLQAISIRDRDNEADATVGKNLMDKGFTPQPSFQAMKWRRRHIEGYLLCKTAIARAAKTEVIEIEDFFNAHAISLPTDHTKSDVAIAIREAHAKEIFTSGDSIKSKFGLTREDIGRTLEQTEIADDIITFFEALTELSK
ncbi:hypothetical protein, partial [Stutzerimonas stutzeri]|uniref:hypothetical protein n=1 Tax=Stutzerimonas stutzeri TaxID=316 RepID=UPI00055A4746